MGEPDQYSLGRLGWQSIVVVVVSCLLTLSISQPGVSGDSSLRELLACPLRASCDGHSRRHPFVATILLLDHYGSQSKEELCGES